MNEGSSGGEDERLALGRALLERGELTRLSAALEGAGEEGRALARRLALERSVLELAGERGYAEVTVEALVERANTNRARFYATFADKEGCYSGAYMLAGEALCARILGRCEEASGWSEGMRLALEDLGALIGEEAAIVAGIVAPGAAPGAVAGPREEVVGRLSRAIDRARRETGSRHPSPPSTSRFILSAIESGVVRVLASGGTADLQEGIAGMLYLAVSTYFGPEAARREVGRLG